MGITVTEWRCRIGTFFMPKPKDKFYCPRMVISTSKLIRLSFICAMLLIMSGIEPNPGPVTRQGSVADENRDDEIKILMGQLSRQLNDNMKDLKTEITSLRTAMETKHDELENKLKTEIQGIKNLVKESNDDMNSKIDELKDENKGLREKIEKLQDEKYQLEDHSRRNNLIFWGLAESQGNYETWDECEAKVREFMKEELEINEAEDETKLQIERAHRLGKKKLNKTRGIIVNFARWKQKQKILAAANETLTRDSRFKVGEDFSRKARETRKLLIPHMIKLRRKYPLKTVQLRYNKIVMDRQTFVLNASKTDIEEVIGNESENENATAAGPY